MPDEYASLNVDDLLDADAYPHPAEHVERVETHLSWVFLTGRLAYKLKKSVDLGFVDFSTPAKRHAACLDELRLNRRFAPDLYLRVDPVTVDERGRARIGGRGETVDHVVVMRQFPRESEMARRVSRGVVTLDELAAFGRDLARTHARLPVPPRDEETLGSAALIRRQAADNPDALRASATVAAARLATLADWTARLGEALDPWFAARRRDGFVRECHGDLHLRNLVWLDGAVTAFDCIEFDAAYRYIDVVSDLAFLFMDCLVRGEVGLAYAFVDAYCEVSGDYDGLRSLAFYTVYRSLVRAKVAAFAAADARGEAATRARQRVARHVELAERLVGRPSPYLILTCGVSGSGKSWLAERLVPRLPAVRIRSDVERKRIHGLEALADSGSSLGAGVYGPPATRATYRRLERAAASVLAGGESVVVDAAFLDEGQRSPFHRLAERLGATARVLYCQAPRDVLEARLATRKGDPSEADRAVLADQLARHEPPAGDEPVLVVNTAQPVDESDVLAAIRAFEGPPGAPSETR